MKFLLWQMVPLGSLSGVALIWICLKITFPCFFVSLSLSPCLSISLSTPHPPSMPPTFYLCKKTFFQATWSFQLAGVGLWVDLFRMSACYQISIILYLFSINYSLCLPPLSPPQSLSLIPKVQKQCNWILFQMIITLRKLL